MPYPSTLTYTQTDSLAPSGAASNTAPRGPPDILTYCYGSRLVYVTPGESYDHAIDIARESFQELKDVERERIRLEVRVTLSNQHERRTAEIGRTAWPVVVATLTRFEVVEVHVTDAPPKAGVASSSSSASEPPPYASDMGWHSSMKGPQTNLASYGSHVSSSLSPPQSLTTRVVDLLTPKSSRGHHSPQPYQNRRY